MISSLLFFFILIIMRKYMEMISSLLISLFILRLKLKFATNGFNDKLSIEIVLFVVGTIGGLLRFL